MGNSQSASNLPALQTVSSCITEKFMGTWFVIAVKPTMFEKTNSNAIEKYSRPGSDKNHDIDINFTYNAKEPISSPVKSLPQKGWIQGLNKEDSGTWKVSPFWPVKLPFLILEVDEQYSYTIIGYPSRDYCWIMARKPKLPQETYDMLIKRLTEKHKYSLDGLRLVPQAWTAEERQKRGLTAVEIPDDMLEKE
ncbi:hypothetical protein ACA910_002647 [Epithemia clementina (nom. ined.)]